MECAVLSEQDVKINSNFHNFQPDLYNNSEELLNQMPLQLKEYETAPYFIQLSQNLTSYCLLISVHLPVFTDFCMM